MRTKEQPAKTIRPRLLELLAEKNLERARKCKPMLTLRDVAKATGISYTALFMFAHNKGKTISFDALAKLMEYFNLTSFDQFFAFIPNQAAGDEEGEDNEEK